MAAFGLLPLYPYTLIPLTLKPCAHIAHDYPSRYSFLSVSTGLAFAAPKMVALVVEIPIAKITDAHRITEIIPTGIW